MSDEELQDFKERLERASKTLLDMQMAAYVDGYDTESLRLKNKREGVTLALSYLAEMVSRGADA